QPARDHHWHHPGAGHAADEPARQHHHPDPLVTPAAQAPATPPQTGTAPGPAWPPPTKCPAEARPVTLTVTIWDAATGKKRAVPARREGAVLFSHVGAVAVVPDGSWLATPTGGPPGGRGEAVVRIWDTATWRERAVLAAHTGSREVLVAAAAPDGRCMAT